MSMWVSDFESTEKANYGEEMVSTCHIRICASIDAYMLYFLFFKDVASHTAAQTTGQPHLLYDRQPLKLNEDDSERVRKIPKERVA